MADTCCEDEADGFTHDDMISDSDISFSDLDNDDSSEDELPPTVDCQGTTGERGDVGKATTNTCNTPVSSGNRWQTTFSEVQVNEFDRKTGPTVVLDSDKKEIDFFRLLFPESLTDFLVEQTNLYALQCMSRKDDPKWRDVSKDEMNAFLGLHVFMSIVQLPSYKHYWTSDKLFRIPSVPSIMTRERFEKILQYFHCSDSAANPPRGEPGHDKIHHVRPILDEVQRNLVSNYHIHKEVSVDEAMISVHGRHSHKQYLSHKPCKFGVRVWELADRHNGYVYQMQVYTGKKESGRAEVGLRARAVTNLTEILSGKNHHVFMEDIFSSPHLFVSLLEKGIYAAGTCRVNCRGWPDGLHSKCLPKERGQSKAYQKGNLVATSWYDNRQVNFLSTNCDPRLVTNVNRKQKDGTVMQVSAPQVVWEYTKYMVGIGHGDQTRKQYPTARRSKKFWKYIFWFLFDTSISCAFILMKESPNHQESRQNGAAKVKSPMEFRQKIASQLIGNYRQKRRYQVNETDSSGRSHWPATMPKRRRCQACKAAKVRRESVYGCAICNVNLCVTCFEPYHARKHVKGEK